MPRRRPPPLDGARLKQLCRRLTPAAAAELRVIADDHGNAVAQEMLAAPRTIEAAVALLSNRRAVDDVAALLHNERIGHSEAFKEALADAGAIDRLVALLEHEDDNMP